MRLFTLGNLFGSTFTYHKAASLTAFRTDVDNMIGAFDHFQVMLNDDDRVPSLYQGIKCFEQGLDIVKMLSRGRFVEYENGGLGFFFTKIEGQLHALVLST